MESKEFESILAKFYGEVKSISVIDPAGNLSQMVFVGGSRHSFLCPASPQ
jgi:hypothetical protein